MRKALLASGVLQIVLLVIILADIYLFPSQNCKLYGDCTDRALGLSFVALPLAVAGLINLVAATTRFSASLHRSGATVWLVVTWLYFAYWLLPTFLYTIL